MACYSLMEFCCGVSFCERDRVLVHAHPQRFHAEVGSDLRPGRQIGPRRLLIQAGACHEGDQGEAYGRAHQRQSAVRLTIGVDISTDDDGM